MGLSKYKLGELIEQCDERNDELKYTLEDVKGISIQKIFIETKADMKDVSLTPYKLVRPDNFAYVTVTSRNGEKITLAHNTTVNTYIVSSSYLIFYLYISTVRNLTAIHALTLGVQQEKLLAGKICAIWILTFRHLPSSKSM